MKPQKQIKIIIKRPPFVEKAFEDVVYKTLAVLENSRITVSQFRLLDSSNRKHAVHLKLQNQLNRQRGVVDELLIYLPFLIYMIFV